MIKKRIILGLTAFLAAVFLAFSSFAGEWRQDKFGRWYEEDGTYPSSQWKQIDGKWYYFRDSGYLATGPLLLDKVQYYMEESGEMAADRWIEFRGNWYYFKEDGSLAKSCWIDDNYYVDRNGRMVTDSWVGDVYVDEEGVGDYPGK